MSFSSTGQRIRQKAVIQAEGFNFGMDVEFDVSENETHRSSAKLTKHPVEEGADISDHIQDEADTLDLVARVSNTPIVSEQEAVALSGDRVAEAYETLRRLMKLKVTVSVLTTLRQYQNMALVAVSVTRNAGTGEVLACNVSLEQIRTAQTETINAPDPRVARGHANIDQGKKPTIEATQQVTEKSETLMLRFGRRISSSVDRLAQ